MDCGNANNTINNIRKAIDRYEEFTKHKDFAINKKIGKAFKMHLLETKGALSGKLLSKSHISSTLFIIKDMFEWLALEQGSRSIDLRDLKPLRLSDKDMEIARTPRRPRVPTIEEIRRIIVRMPAKTETELRNRALVAGILLTGMRDNAAASLLLKYVRLEEELVEQRGEGMRTKYSKTIYSYFFPVGDDIQKIFVDWVQYLREVRGFNGNDPVFPQTNIIHGKNNEFINSGLKPVVWANANPIRRIFKEACANAGLEYYNPHSFRATLTRLGQQLCRTPEEFKVWSQNLGHTEVMTTFLNYGKLPEHRQSELIKNMKNRGPDTTKDDIKELIALIKARDGVV